MLNLFLDKSRPYEKENNKTARKMTRSAYLKIYAS